MRRPIKRVLLIPHEDSGTFFGGHVTQFRATLRALQEAGVDARAGTGVEALSGDVDVVHVFGDVRQVLRHGRPDALVAVTPIYFPLALLDGADWNRPGYAYKAYKRGRHAASWLRAPRRRYYRRRALAERARALCDADLLLASSANEAAQLRRDIAHAPAIAVVRNCVDESMFSGDPARGRELLGLDDEPFVLSVARVERNKNPLALALALAPLDLPLVLVGAGGRRQEYYEESVKRAARRLLRVEHIEHDELRHVYAAAAVHALPSFFETTGLATLEALAAGTPVVVTDAPAQREYFGDCAQFCRPFSVRSVRHALLRALEGPSGRELEVARSFSSQRTAQELLSAYER
ncbi:MAG: glycosyltransferase [Solirubrobacteraceae bacterium]